MRFLIDNALPPGLADLLAAAGFNAVHVRTYNMSAARDDEILELVLREDRVVVSADTDFGTLLAIQNAEFPSFVLFRNTDLLKADDYLALLQRALPTLEPELMGGCVAVFRDNRLSVRKLPLSAWRL